MSLNIGDALAVGFEKLRTPAGLQLGALYVFAVVLTALGANSITVALAPDLPPSAAPALALPVGVAGGTALLFLGIVVGAVLSVVVFRAVDHPPAELDTIPDGLTHALPRTVLFLFVAGVIQGVLVAVGIVLLIIPGLFVLVSLYFSQVYIAVEGEGPLEGLASSWSLATGNRFRIFGLVVVVGVVSLLVSAVGQVAGVASPLAGSLLSLVLSGFLTVFTSAVIVDAYHQLSSEQAERADLLEQPT